jgi:hypothetical protein
MLKDPELLNQISEEMRRFSLDDILQYTPFPKPIIKDDEISSTSSHPYTSNTWWKDIRKEILASDSMLSNSSQISNLNLSSDNQSLDKKSMPLNHIPRSRSIPNLDMQSMSTFNPFVLKSSKSVESISSSSSNSSLDNQSLDNPTFSQSSISSHNSPKPVSRMEDFFKNNIKSSETQESNSRFKYRQALLEAKIAHLGL